MLPRPQGWRVVTPPQWEVVRGGGAEGFWLTGFPLDAVRLSPRPRVLGLAWATGPASPSHHGVSAPAPLRVGSGHRFRGSLPGRVGVPGPCQRAPSLGSLALLGPLTSARLSHYRGLPYLRCGQRHRPRDQRAPGERGRRRGRLRPGRGSGTGHRAAAGRLRERGRGAAREARRIPGGRVAGPRSQAPAGASAGEPLTASHSSRPGLLWSLVSASPLPPIGLLFSPAICRCVLCGHHTR